MKKLFEFVSQEMDFIAYGVSVMFALFVVAMAVIETGWFFVILSIPLISINFFLSRRFPNRFASWIDSADIKSFLFVPPFSIISMSIALIVFIVHFFDPSAKEIWSKLSGQVLPDLLNIAGAQMIIVPLFAIITIGIPFIAISFIGKKFGKNLFMLFGLIYLLLLWYFFIYFAKEGNRIIPAEMISLTGKIIAFTVGFIPIHWFYEIFIGSLAVKPSISRHLYKIQNK